VDWQAASAFKETMVMLVMSFMNNWLPKGARKRSLLIGFRPCS